MFQINLYTESQLSMLKIKVTDPNEYKMSLT